MMNENQIKLIDDARRLLGSLILASPEEPFDPMHISDALLYLSAAQDGYLDHNTEALILRCRQILVWLLDHPEPTLDDTNVMFANLPRPLGPFTVRTYQAPRHLCLVVAATQLATALGRYVK